MEKKNSNTLKVNKGVDQPSVVNPVFEQGLKQYKKQKPDVDTLLRGILQHDRSTLSRAITLIESSLSKDQKVAQALIQKCLPYAGHSLRLGITGVPGVGKSTFIEAFGLYLIKKGKRVAVLAIDPSSTRNKGSILGDKTRMEQLSSQPSAFIRPSASSGTLGGVARKTRETILLCEAAGYDTLFIETVGVGQSETAVAQIVDFFLLLMLSGGGDELQGIKRGIMEMADLVVINKADGDNIKRAQLAKRAYENALHLFPPLENGWTPKVVTASAINHSGLEVIYQNIQTFLKQTQSNGYFNKNRQQQAVTLFEENIRHALIDRFFQHPDMKQLFEDYRQKIAKNKTSPYEAAEELLSIYYQR